MCRTHSTHQLSVISHLTGPTPVIAYFLVAVTKHPATAGREGLFQLKCKVYVGGECMIVRLWAAVTLHL